MKKILFACLFGLIASCATTGAKKVNTLEDGLEKDSAAKLQTFFNTLVVETRKEVDKNVLFAMKIVEYDFQDNFHLALLHVSLTVGKDGKTEKGHMFFVLGRLDTDAEWMLLNSFARREE